MSEVADNVAPEASDNAAPAEAQAEVKDVAEGSFKIDKFGQLLEMAPEDLRGAKTWEKFKDVDVPTALKAIVDMDKWTGKRGDIPQQDASDEEWSKFYEKIGVPKEATGYEYAFDEATKTALGGEADALTAYVGEMKNLALKHKIPAKAMDGFLADAMAYEMNLRSSTAEQTKEQKDADLAALEKEWGDSFDEMAQSVQALEKHYGLTDEEMDMVEASPLFNKLLGRIAKDLDEKGQAGNAFSNTQIGIKDELADTKARAQQILMENKGDVNDKRLVPLFERIRRLEHKLA